MIPWRWADHACRICGARLGVAEMPNGSTVFECGNCGVRSTGAPDGICGCGVHLGPKPRDRGRLPPPPKGPRFHCTPNPARSPASPAAIVILWGDIP